LEGKKLGMSFHLVWWSFVFPNAGFAICTIKIGQAFMSEGILWVGSAMTIILVAVGLFVGGMHIRAVWKNQIMWPWKDEDHGQ
jgi:tellurite resistance protein TehA-like permease